MHTRVISKQKISNNMSRFNFLTILAAVVVLSCSGKEQTPDTGLGTSTGTKPETPTVVTPTKDTYYTNPVYSEQAHADPTVIRVGNMFYSYSTSTRMRILKSPDLVNWTFVNTSFTAQNRPDWAKNADGTSAYLWAPDIAYHGGKYLLYYSLAAEHYGIGVAVADSPEGPFEDKGKLIQNGDIDGLLGTIDPTFYREDGHNYLIWGSHNGIFITELSEDGLSLKEPASKDTITKICRDTWEGPIIYKRGDYYYFFGSTGVTILKNDRTEADITYKVQVGRATSLFGPYLNKAGNSLLEVGTYTLLQGNDSFIGPGHHSEIIEDDNGDTWMLYHAFVKGHASESGRVLCLDKVEWDQDGWPVMNSGKGPTTKAKAPYFKK